MYEDEIIPQEDTIPAEGQDSTPEEELIVEDSDTQEELAKEREEKNRQRVRADRAEKALRDSKKAPKQDGEPQISGLSMSIRDIKALQDVPEDDVEEVIDFAKYKGISIADAKKSQVIQTILKTRAEERATAAVANTNTQRRGTKSNFGDSLLRKIDKKEDMSQEEMQEAARLMVEGMRTKRE